MQEMPRALDAHGELCEHVMTVPVMNDHVQRLFRRGGKKEIIVYVQHWETFESHELGSDWMRVAHILADIVVHSRSGINGSEIQQNIIISPKVQNLENDVLYGGFQIPDFEHWLLFCTTSAAKKGPAPKLNRTEFKLCMLGFQRYRTPFGAARRRLAARPRPDGRRDPCS